MISLDTAQAMVLRRSEGDPHSDRYEKFAVQSCELSTRGDYWIVRVNSEAYVLHGQVEHCYVGANAHLVDVASGQIETVCSGQSVESYLQQKYDIESAAGMHYTLQPTFGRSDKAAIIRFKQTFACSLQSALRLAMPEHRNWLSGPRYVLQSVQAHLAEKDIGTEIVLLSDPIGAVDITIEPWFWQDVKSALKQKLCVLG